jgi:hypothetical protein
MSPMKFNVLLSILFAIVTSFAAIHEVKHIEHNDAASCLICTVNNNLVSGDAVKIVLDVEIFHFENIAQNNQITYLHVRTNSNQTRAPPSLS